MEKWKDIPNTNGNYSASTLGRIKSNDKYLTYLDGRKYFVKGRILTPCKMSSGYLKITTSNNLEKKQLSVSIYQVLAGWKTQHTCSKQNHLIYTTMPNCFLFWQKIKISAMRLVNAVIN